MCDHGGESIGVSTDGPHIADSVQHVVEAPIRRLRVKDRRERFESTIVLIRPAETATRPSSLMARHRTRPQPFDSEGSPRWPFVV